MYTCVHACLFVGVCVHVCVCVYACVCLSSQCLLSSPQSSPTNRLVRSLSKRFKRRRPASYISSGSSLVQQQPHSPGNSQTSSDVTATIALGERERANSCPECHTYLTGSCILGIRAVCGGQAGQLVHNSGRERGREGGREGEGEREGVMGESHGRLVQYRQTG